MRAPKKVIAAMAMATLLGSGANSVFAAPMTGFEASGVDAEGRAIQTTTISNQTGQDLNDCGEIEINGKFTKTVTTLPVPSEVGHYLRVTMPIKVDFTYDVDKDELQSPDIKIINESVNVKSESDREYKPVKMSFVGLNEGTGVGTINDSVKFVESIDQEDKDDKIQLPFEINVAGKKGIAAGTYSFAKLEELSKTVEDDYLTPITIQPQSTVTLNIGKINDQGIWNKEKITEGVTSTSHSLKMLFEYQNK